MNVSCSNYNIHYMQICKCLTLSCVVQRDLTILSTDVSVDSSIYPEKVHNPELTALDTTADEQHEDYSQLLQVRVQISGEQILLSLHSHSYFIFCAVSVRMKTGQSLLIQNFHRRTPCLFIHLSWTLSQHFPAVRYL